MKNCPFCKSTDVAPTQHSRKSWTVMCLDCEAEGPVKTTGQEAIDAWNKRVEQPAEEKAAA